MTNDALKTSSEVPAPIQFSIPPFCWYHYILIPAFICSLTVLVLATFWSQPNATDQTLFGAISLITGLLIIITIVARRYKKISLQIIEDEITATINKKQTTIKVENAQGICLKEQERIVNGEYVGHEVFLVLWDTDPSQTPAKIRIEGFLPVSTSDHDRFLAVAEPTFGKINQQLVKRFKEGYEIRSHDFTINKQGLRLNHKTIPLEQVEMATLVKDKVCIWTGTDETPSIQIPREGINALPLLFLVRDLVEQRHEAEKVPGYGRIIYEHRDNQNTTKLFSSITCLFLVTAYLLLCNAIMEQSLLFYALSTTCFVCAIGLALVAFYKSKHYVRCREKGLEKRALFKYERLRYDEAKAFQYETIRQFCGGVYNGTDIKLRLTPLPHKGNSTVSFHCTVRDEEESELNELRDHIANQIAERIVAEIEKEKFYEFEHLGITLTRNSLSYNPPSETTPPECYLLTTLGPPKVYKGEFYLFEKEMKHMIMKLPISAPNFYPFLFTLLTLRNEKAHISIFKPLRPISETTT